MIQRPSGLAAIRATFGDPRDYVREDGTLSPIWEAARMRFARLPEPLPLSWLPDKTVSRIRCHELVVEPFELAFDRVHRAGLWPEMRDFGGSFAWRAQRGSGKLSTHAWGIAADFDVARNPLGQEPTMHAGIVQAFESAGFYWGGRFGRPDGMHFQFADGY